MPLSKRGLFLVVTLCVIANLVLGSIVLAKGLEINDKDVEKIKSSLDLTKTFLNIVITDDKLKTILNTTIGVGETSTDITYGLLVLSAFNEMEFVDLVVSQRYKTEATSYFNSILDEKLNLMNYYKGIGYDLPKVMSGAITGPMVALTLNTFDITSKVINILIAFENLKNMKMYDGLWVYFDDRRSNETHEFAWEEAKIVMGGAIKRTSFHSSIKMKDDNEVQLESQFVALWDKWGSNTTPFGVKEEFKQQVQNELYDSIVYAIKTHENELVQEETKPSFVARVKLTLENLKKEIERIGGLAKNKLVQVKTKIQESLRFGGAQIVPPSAEEEIEIIEEIEQSVEQEPKTEVKTEAITESKPEPKPKPSLNEIQEILDDIAEKIDVINQQTMELVQKRGAKLLFENKVDEIEDENKIEKEKEEELQEEEIEIEKQQETIICQKKAGDYSARNKLIFNEIAWMGTTVSSSDEWVELKNISGSIIDLIGWQLLDKDQNIKIIFDRGRVSNNGFYLLERSDDGSVPNITADLIYTGSLNNSSEFLYLFDSNCQLQDEIEAFFDWPEGENSSKRTMERKDNLAWQTSSNIGGTPKRENSSGFIEAPTHVGGGGGGGGTSSPPTYPKILISEIQISPIEERFIELYNPNNKEVNLTDWYIQRKTETGTSWTSLISSTKFEGKSIQPQSHFLIARSPILNPNILLDLTLTENNSLVFKNPNRGIVDKVGWGQAQDFETAPFSQNPEESQTLGRKWDSQEEKYQDIDNNQEDFELQFSTPKAQNETFQDIISPETTIESQPDILTNQIQANFTFSSNEKNCSFECKIDDQSWENCMSPKDYNNLTEGNHQFQVWSTDVVGNIDQTPVIFNWVIEISKESPLTDIIPPTRFNSQPTETLVSGTTQATISLSTDELATCKYSVDPGEDYDSMTETFSNTDGASHSALVAGLTDGNAYNYYIRCVDVSENKNTDDFIITFSTSSTEEIPIMTVIINEIAWMGTNLNHADEWIELYNNTDQEIDLGEWILRSANGTPQIELVGIIQAQNYFILERTDDNTISDVLVDLIYAGALGNDGEKLELLDPHGNLIDLIDCSENWFAGDNDKKATMERVDSVLDGCDPSNWANNNLITRNGLDAESNKINGTPKAQNSVSVSSTIISSLPFSEFSEITLSYYGSPYIVENNLTVPQNKTLIVEPGVILKFWQNGIEIEGKLNAIGGEEDDKKVVFTSLKDDELGGDTNNDGSSIGSAGDWDWLYFKESLGSQLKNVIIRYGGKIYGGFPWGPGWTKGMVQVEDGEITIEDSIIEKSLTVGLWLINSSGRIDRVNFLKMESGFSWINNLGQDSIALFIEKEGNLIVQNSTFEENTIGIKTISNAYPEIKDNFFSKNETPIEISIPSYPLFSNNQAENNTLNGILVTGGDIIQDTTWQADLPYIIESKAISGGVILTIEKGTIVKIKSFGYLEIYGQLITKGTLTEPVVITSFTDSSESRWKYLFFHSSGSILDGVIVKHGLGHCEYNDCWGAITQLKDVEVEIKNSTMENNKWAIVSRELSCEEAFNKIKIENSIFSNNEVDIGLDKGWTSEGCD